ncbi:hypothetical protein C2745_00745 [Polynucleobacter sp. AP-Kolm-20A-A1]|nr:hypothetical protein C2745_00745 [Polynucleobacter sp. AP-Kolm-20A-A1]
MGFLAFLVIGAISGASAWMFYPGRSSGSGLGKFLLAMLVGFIFAAAGAYFGQYMGFFESGQMLEWLSAIFASCLASCVYSALAK